MFEDVLDPATCGDLTPREMVDAIAACHRAEATMVARKLAFTHKLLAHHKDNAADEEKTWAHDEWAHVRDQIGPAMRLSPWRASGQMRLAEGLARNPQTAALLHAGRINVRVAETIIYRTELINPSAQAAVDAQIAAEAGSYTLLSEKELGSALDAIIEVHDPDAVRRYREAAKNCEVGFGKRDDATGTSSMYGRISAADAELGARVLTALVKTVCANDPRSKGELRAAAQGAVYRGQNRLVCHCNAPDCVAATLPSAVPSTVIHVLAEHEALEEILAQIDALRQPQSSGSTAAPPTVDLDSVIEAADAAEAARPAAPPEPPPPGEEPKPAPEPPVDGAPDWSHWFTTDTGDGDGDGDEPPWATGSSPQPPPGPGDPDTDGGGATAVPTDEADESNSASPQAPAAPTAPQTPAAFVPPRRPRPAVTLGGAIIPLDLLAEMIRDGATITALPIPTAPPASGYRFTGSTREFVQCRDMGCRFPGCNNKAEYADIDHTQPYDEEGATHPSNGKVLCRTHHLTKTFREGPDGWRDRQLPCGEVHWTAPTGHTYITAPTSKLLFPDWDPTTAALPPPTRPRRRRNTPGPAMPIRKSTREQEREYRINAEREYNAMQRALGKPPGKPPI
ncbi:hypothetical protein BVC93_23480 [Mycobacterium sp. MS1601]|uniref:HNH endonuclease signature motif containing protein n=1 Tax=Mycobacterium sp. MS1601 TaxID=1936029 RepID=UPI00097914C6|nr:HNH endonuclease signature motif containing protein [Mycobacterium sp. MS1601]AQA04886.1 hypothetical protein BVC93_23480 [Mycobacterium sp. MS1601]